MSTLRRKALKAIGQYVGLVFFLFITGAIYYFIIRDGWSYFYNEIVGVVLAIIFPVLCVLYYIIFLRKQK